MARLVLLALLVLLVAVPNGAATTQPSFTVGVNVTLKPGAVTLSSTSVRRGHYVQFKVKNTTGSRRSFSLAGRRIAIPARKVRLFAIEFDVRGTYAYVSRGGSGTPVRGTFRVS